MAIDDARAHDLFSSLDDAEWAAASFGAIERRYEAGALLFQRGDPARAYFYVQEGSVKLLRRNAEGHEQVIEVIEAGQTFAEALVFRGGRYPVDAITLRTSRLVAFEGERLRQLLETSSEAALALIARLSIRVHTLVATVHALALQSAQERVAGFIIARAGDGERFTLGYPKNVLAARLGMTPESLSRSLAALKRRGMLEVHGNEFVVLDRGRLESLD